MLRMFIVILFSFFGLHTKAASPTFCSEIPGLLPDWTPYATHQKIRYLFRQIGAVETSELYNPDSQWRVFVTLPQAKGYMNEPQWVDSTFTEAQKDAWWRNWSSKHLPERIKRGGGSIPVIESHLIQPLMVAEAYGLRVLSGEEAGSFTHGVFKLEGSLRDFVSWYIFNLNPGFLTGEQVAKQPPRPTPGGLLPPSR